MLGVLDGTGDPEDPDPVNRMSAKLQCVVARAAPSDLIYEAKLKDSATISSFMGMRLPKNANDKSIEYKTYWEASPINHVSKDDPPFLLLHGDKDEAVPFENSVMMEKALSGAGVKVKLLPIPGGGHGPGFKGAINPPDYMGEMMKWFDSYLKIK